MKSVWYNPPVEPNDNDKTYADILHHLEQQELLPNGTRELCNVQITFDPDLQLSTAKSKYVFNELQWYGSQDRCIKGHTGIENNPTWKKCATENGFVNSNYGWCIDSSENASQYRHAVRALINDKWTRQSCCIYIRPTIHLQHNDGVHANSDFICTFATQHMIRANELDYTVYMRSNDIRFGLPYDLAWHQHVYYRMFHELRIQYQELKKGNIVWNATSLHLYEGGEEIR